MLAALLLNAGLGVRVRPGSSDARPAEIVCRRPCGEFDRPDRVSFWLSREQSVDGTMPTRCKTSSWDWPRCLDAHRWIVDGLGAKNADGELTLSLGLVLFSTLLSPVTTPLALIPRA